MTTTETVLHAYKNGNCNVTLWSGGTKSRETLDADPPWAEHPESIDIKITNFCDLACPYCHENSTLEGKHGDLIRLLKALEPLPPGVELAIGGGNPLSHPDLIPFLRKVKTKGLVANLTVNERHLEPYKFLLSYLRRKDLIKGIGVSVTGSNLPLVRQFLKNNPHTVFHVIAGVHSPRVLSDLSTLPNSKTLVLGYKTFGRGVQFYGNKTKQLLSEWCRAIPTFLGKTHLSFDNLAVDQLNIRRLLTNEGWSKFYMGDDGSFTMYIDAVDGTYAKTSRSSERTSFDNTDLISYFQSLTPKRFG
jgi:hypothetical protein